jgi:hypothetical protein
MRLEPKRLGSIDSLALEKLEIGQVAWCDLSPWTYWARPESRSGTTLMREPSLKLVAGCGKHFR